MSLANYFEAPRVYEPCPGPPTVFLAGGITGCPNWQLSAAEYLNEHATPRYRVFNPNRANFPIDDPAAATAQIKWEFDHLRKADLILFWFPAESVCPIALFELGYWLGQTKPLLVATHADYPRRLDVVQQTTLVRPEAVVLGDLYSLIKRVALLGAGRHLQYANEPK